MSARFPFTSALAAVWAASLTAQTVTLDPLVISATRAARPLSELPVTVDVLPAEAVVASPALAIDDTLKDSAAFSLFRRTSSLATHPTAQGVSLRNLGPNGAGRTLVLVDGIPLNDPFGGWVTWTKAPRLDLAGVEIVRGGGSSAWGSAALGGTVQLFTQPNESATNRLRLEAGDFGTLGAEFVGHTPAGSGQLRFAARGLTSDGFRRTDPAHAGPIDRPTSLDEAWVQLGWLGTNAAGTTTGFTARVFGEERGNGTPLQANDTREAKVGAHASGRRDLLGMPADWTAAAYFQTQEFASLFTAVTDARDDETPVLDQYSVPADTFGAATTATWAGDGNVTTLGADVRWVRGETNERYFRVGNAFTRERQAGGEAALAGLFVQHDRAVSPTVHANLSARLDAWALRDGVRRETDTTTGAVTREDTLADRDGVEFSPRAGIVAELAAGWRATAAVYQAFRLPTLNELYRPFRVGSVITEANPNLKPESLTGGEAGLHWTGERGSLRVTAFANALDDAVANVTLGYGPGVVPGVGFVPAGGIGRRRENLERVRVNGLELSGTWQADDTLALRFDYLYSDATDTATDLRLPQVSRHTLVLGADWQPAPRWTVGGRLRYVSDAFDDDDNLLVLDAATTVDLRLGWMVSDRMEVFAAMENVFDEDVVAGRDPSGQLDLGTPGFSRAGVTWTW